MRAWGERDRLQASLLAGLRCSHRWRCVSEGLDGEVSHHRDLLTHLKHERDRLRAENMKLKQQGGMMDDALLEDFEGREVRTTSSANACFGNCVYHFKRTD